MLLIEMNVHTRVAAHNYTYMYMQPHLNLESFDPSRNYNL